MLEEVKYPLARIGPPFDSLSKKRAWSVNACKSCITLMLWFLYVCEVFVESHARLLPFVKRSQRTRPDVRGCADPCRINRIEEESTHIKYDDEPAFDEPQPVILRYAFK